MEENVTGKQETVSGENDTLEDMLRESGNNVPLNAINTLAVKISKIETKLEKCFEKLIPQADELKAAEKVIAELSTRYKELNEQFYEREVLSPVLFCLIAIADRCHQQIKEHQTLLEKHAKSKNEIAMKAIKYLINTRKADLVEIENALAKYGVEDFRNSDQKFDPALQKHIDAVPCKQAEQHGLIARRLLPGYRRNEKVLRKECVVVYTLKTNNVTLKGD